MKGISLSEMETSRPQTSCIKLLGEWCVKKRQNIGALRGKNPNNGYDYSFVMGRNHRTKDEFRILGDTMTPRRDLFGNALLRPSDCWIAEYLNKETEGRARYQTDSGSNPRY
jgi:hypothetical protein